ncbi:unnamed protein product [Ostreobium quekettii]|uniref:Uncharacterized protein n=1 Tax=Ostreobium quekettii TaxID=121088 RepID=A0A8S1J1R0_9CHLO|nr:unnamed protein product [Ostreobium quekettii]
MLAIGMGTQAQWSAGSWFHGNFTTRKGALSISTDVLVVAMMTVAMLLFTSILGVEALKRYSRSCEWCNVKTGVDYQQGWLHSGNGGSHVVVVWWVVHFDFGCGGLQRMLREPRCTLQWQTIG